MQKTSRNKIGMFCRFLVNETVPKPNVVPTETENDGERYLRKKEKTFFKV